jgi:hypothetical protein
VGDNIRMDLGEVGWGDVDWIGLARDRNRWRAVVNSVLNLVEMCNITTVRRPLPPSSKWYRNNFVLCKGSRECSTRRNIF